jgi:hypothetical protein
MAACVAGQRSGRARFCLVAARNGLRTFVLPFQLTIRDQAAVTFEVMLFAQTEPVSWRTGIAVIVEQWLAFPRSVETSAARRHLRIRGLRHTGTPLDSLLPPKQ